MRKQNFVKGSLILAGAAAAAKILGAMFKIPLADILGGVGMGYFSSAYSLFLPVYAVFVSGLSSASSILISETVVMEGEEAAEMLRRKLLFLFSLTGLAGMFLILGIAYPFSAYVLGDREAFASVAAIAPSVFFGCVTSVYRGYFEGMKNMYPTAFSQLAEAAVKLAAGLIFGKAASDNPELMMRYFHISGPSATAAGAVAGVTLSSLAGMLCIITTRRSTLGIQKRSRLNLKYSDLGSVISVAAPVAAGALISNLASLADLITIMRCSGRSFSAAYSVYCSKYPFLSEMSEKEFAAFAYGSYSGLSVTVYNIIPSFTNILGKSIIPHVSHAWNSNDRKSVSDHINSVLRIVMISAVPAGLGLCVISEHVLALLFPVSTEETIFAAKSLTVLAPSVVLVCLSLPLFSILQSVGRADIPVKIMIPALIIKIAGNLILVPVPEYNISGAALSTAVCYLFIAAAGIISIKRVCSAEIDIREVILNPLYAGLVCMGTASICVNKLENVVSEAAVLVSAAVVSGAFSYILVLFILGDRSVRSVLCRKKEPPDIIRRL